MSDSLTFIFPDASISFLGLDLSPHQLFALTTAIAVLPTVWLKNLSVLSYLSGDAFGKLTELVNNCSICSSEPEPEVFIFFCVSCWGGCDDIGHNLLALGGCGRSNRIPSWWKGTKSGGSSGCSWIIWFWLLWPFGFPKYIFFHEETISISDCPHNLVQQ